MMRVELKRVAEILWKGPPDEKTPFASRGSLPDNGSFSKNFDSEDIKKSTKEFLEEDEKNVEEAGPMSLPRKFCFVMSFNVWILYFLALGWLIPCRKLECGLPYPDIVETNMSSIWLLTNLETMNYKGLPSVAMLGYGNGTELKLAALATFDASFLWNNSLPFIPRNIQCNFEVPFDANGDGIPDCLLSGYNDVYAFNATNGHVFWHQNIPSEEGNILSGFHPTLPRDGRSFVIGSYGDMLVAIDARNGTKISEVDLPCQSPFEIRFVQNVIDANSTLWSLVCDYGDEIEAWSFREQNVLTDENFERKDNVSDFALLFSGSNNGGSIDLRCDVTAIPGGPLLLSWSDRVVMVTQEAIAWEHTFPEPLSVASVEVGYFSKSEELQIAAAVHNSTNAIIYMMEMKNGTIVDSLMLRDRQVESMDKIHAGKDLLVLKSLFLNSTSQSEYNFSDPIPVEKTNFVLIDYSSGSFTVEEIATAGLVVGSTLSTQTNGEADLLVVKSENGYTSYLKYVLHDAAQDNVMCAGSRHRHHYSLEA